MTTTTLTRVPAQIVVVVSMIAITSPAIAADLLVPEDFPEVQAALDVAVAGDRVLVGPGVYADGIDFHGKDVRLESTHGPNVTIIEGDGSWWSKGVRIGPYGAIEGFTIRNTLNGVEVCCFGTTIRGNIFENNNASGIKGNGSADISGNLFRYNSCYGSFLDGVVAFWDYSQPRIVNNVFFNNNCTGVSMVLPTGSKPSVLNNTFVGNRVAIHVTASAPAAVPFFRNNLITQNETGLQVESGTQVNNLVWENNLVFANDFDYQGIQDLTGLSGNIAEAPDLVDVASADLRLLPSSPAIDNGSETSAPNTDFEGNLRPLDGDGDGEPRTDIGAFEFNEPPLNPSIVVELRRGKRMNLRRHLARVVLLSSEGFDARASNLNTFAFGPMGSAPTGLFFFDVDHDDTDDLVLFFNVAEAGLDLSVQEACLRGVTLRGRRFEACDEVRVFEGRRGRRLVDRLWFMLQTLFEGSNRSQWPHGVVHAPPSLGSSLSHRSDRGRP